jgi:ribose-phosphate pyrophosphokinase
MIYINGSPLNVTLFPDRTSQVWQVPQLNIPDTNWVHIKWVFESEAEFIHLAQLKHLLDKKGFKATLRLSYLPYGRQDKEVSNEATFALRTFNKYIDFMDWDEIIVMDPHSSVLKNYVRNVREVYPTDEVEKVFLATETTAICYPDKGAIKKYTPIYEKLGYMHKILHGEKVRDQSTGKILSYALNEPDLIHEENVLIIDDICDGGATFVLLAKELYKYGAENVNLFVTHGLFTKGLKPLFDAGIKRIFTQDGEASEIQNHIAYRRL